MYRSTLAAASCRTTRQSTATIASTSGATWSKRGSGIFIHLHILDVAAAPGFDFDGNLYQRINLTNLRTIPLGDRWDGEISIEKNTITVVTTRAGPADDSGIRRTSTIEAKRP